MLLFISISERREETNYRHEERKNKMEGATKTDRQRHRQAKRKGQRGKNKPETDREKGSTKKRERQ